MRWVRTFQAVVVLSWAAVLLPTARADTDALSVDVSVLGAMEAPDGSWIAVDLLASPEAEVDRAQITVTTPRVATLRLDEVTDHGTIQIFPRGTNGFVAKPDVAYALPTPSTFFELRGTTRIRLVGEASVSPNPEPPRVVGTATYPLPDGSLAVVSVRRYRSAAPEWVVRGRK
jgi:hypothetical protein